MQLILDSKLLHLFNVPKQILCTALTVYIFSFCRVLIGSPLAGQPQKKTGDVYKCPVGQGNGLPCVKLNLPGKKVNEKKLQFHLP